MDPNLKQRLTKFNELVFKEFKINMNNYSTLASLSFANYRTNYLEEGILPVIDGKVYEDLRQGYIGGHVDMYIPTNEQDTKVVVLDVNSLYPAVMKDNPMPIGEPTYFKGDILKYEPDAYGFFYCEVTTPKYLKHPILLIHVRSKEGIRTIAPLGTFKCMIYSEEMRNALKYGYKFKVLYGYLFKKGYIFEGIITKLHNLRTTYPKDNPLNLIAKLFMNSLYGRFGMLEYLPETILIDEVDLESKLAEWRLKNYEIVDVMPFGSKVLVQILNKKKSSNINIAISMAISSLGRIHMYQFKNREDIILYYTDTDSVHINKLLPEDLISNTELGKMKLESINTKAVYIAPKVYALRNTEGIETIKIKGLSSESISSNNINLDTLESLLIKDSVLETNQEKWFKNLQEGTISINEQIYTLKVTGNKRELIYKDNVLVDTEPLSINE